MLCTKLFPSVGEFWYYYIKERENMHKKLSYSIGMQFLYAYCSLFSQQEVAYLFSHGIWDSKEQAYRYTKEIPDNFKKAHDYYIIDGLFETFDYPDAKYKIYHTSLGQKNEVEILVDQLYKTIGKHQKDIVLVGVSRGAVAAFNMIGLYDLPQIKALVIESPFESPKTVLEHNLSKVSFFSKIAHFAKKIMAYKEDGIQAIELVENIPQDLPILIIASKEDSRVPIESSILLYNRLVETDHSNIHLLILEKGKHGNLFSGYEGQKYQNVTHAFYKKYGLPYNKFFAKCGKYEFANTQPKSAGLAVFLSSYEN